MNCDTKCDRDNRSRYTITYRTEWIERFGYFWGHVSTSGRRSRTFLGSFAGTCARIELFASSISGRRLEPGFLTLGSTGKRNQVADGKKIRVEKLWKIN